MEQNIVFKDIGFEFTEEELEDVSIETLDRCEQKLEDVIEKLINNKGDT